LVSSLFLVVVMRMTYYYFMRFLCFFVRFLINMEPMPVHLAGEVPSPLFPRLQSRSGAPKLWIIPRKMGIKKILRWRTLLMDELSFGVAF
jgi:hypothetical protein